MALENLVKMTGWVSLILQMIGTMMLSFLGESVNMWIIFIVSSITGIAFNSALLLECQRKHLKVNNVQSLILFSFYLFTNIIGIIRLSGW